MLLKVGMAVGATLALAEGSHDPARESPGPVQSQIGVFCDIPHAKICDPFNVAKTKQATDAALQKIKALRELAKAAGEKARDAVLEKKAKEQSGVPEGKRGIKLIVSPEDEAFDEAFLDTFHRELNRELPKVGQHFKKVIQRLLAKSQSMNLSEEGKKKAKAVLEGARVITHLNQFTPEDLKNQADSSYLYHCKGGSGLKAFYLEKPNVIVICPGDLLFDLFRSQDGEGNLDLVAFEQHLMFTLAHESGHGIDAGILPEGEFGELLKCLKTYSAEPDDFVSKRNEVTADWWAAEVLAAEVAALPESQRIELLQRSFAPLCQYEESGLRHPAMVPRLRMMLSNASLRNALNCPAPTVDQPACSLEGRSPKRSTAPTSPFSK